MSEATETFGKGGLGNAAPASHVNHAVETTTHHPDNATGRGGAANIGTGAGHYDTTGGHDVSESGGKGGYGNITQHHHSDEKATKHARRTSVVDIVIGSALVTFGKVTKNAALIEKGNARKAGPAPAPTTTTTAAAPAPSTA